MRLCATGTTVRRTWTLELRPQHGGTLMACPQCPTGSRPLPLATAATLRPTVVAHLAGHARRDALPAHLRTCQCRERGCPWHPRHRGCSGPITLVLTCERGGRLWRLTDACIACAQATAHSAIVPETALTTSGRPTPPRRRRGRGNGPAAVVRVGEMLSYLAVALPPPTTASARLLAVQCALRTTGSGRLWMPAGLLKGMQLGPGSAPWQELEHARWLCRLPTAPASGRSGVAAQFLDATVLAQAPGRRDRARAADWALRVAYHAKLRSQQGPGRLVALALHAHLSPDGVRGVIEADRLAYMCAMPASTLFSLLDSIAAAGALRSWAHDPATEDITWSLPCPPAGP
jgi:hypothetical protein